MTASIVINDGGGPIVGSVERDFTYIGNVFTLSNANNTGVLAWEWILKDKPEGSSASISAPTAASPTLTPDIPGTYLIQLRTYSDAAATLFDDLDVEAVGIEYGGTETYRIPAAGETNQFDSTRGWAAEVNRILIDLRSKIGGGGGGAGKQTHKIIVGNSLEGDTLADCDYLDVGDCAQLLLALAAAGADDDVYIRPGTYDLGAGATVAPLAIPANVSVRGAGWFQTRIVCKSSGDMGAFTLGTFASLRDVSITVPVTTAAGSGSTAVVFSNGTGIAVERVAVAWTPGYGAPEVADLVLRATFGNSGLSNVVYDRCYAAVMPSLRDLGISDDLCGFASAAGAAGAPLSFSRCYIQGGDIGFRSAVPVNIYDCATVECYASHVSVLAGGTDQGCVVDKLSAFASVNDPTGGFIRVTSKQTRVNDCTVRWTGGLASTAPGISLVGADECVLKGNVIVFCGTGINLDATSDNNIVLMNQLPTCTTAIADAGAGNDIAHNI